MPKTPIPIKRRVRIYLATHDMTQHQLALQLRITPSHLSGILSRKQPVSLRVAADIEALTGIPARDFVLEAADALAAEETF